MKTNAPYRLKASTQGVFADSALHISDWWKELPTPDKKNYLEQHPNSKYAEQAIKEGEENNHPATKGLEPGSKARKGWAQSFRQAKAKISHEVKRTFPLMTNAVGAMGSMAQGKPLTHHQKEVMHELGHIIVKAGATHLVGDINAGAALAKLGITAVSHAIDHFKDKKAENPKQDNLDTFIDAVADGVENAKEAPVPKEHAEPSSKYRAALSKAVKSATKHTTAVIEKSFSNVKPAMGGLQALATGKKMDDHQKHALKQCGKYALATTIATLPGGIAAHLAAGAGVAALSHAYKAVKGQDVTGRELLGKFVESIGEGLEHAAIHHLAGHHGGGEGGEGHGGGGEDGMSLSDIGNHSLGFGDMKDFGGHGGHGGHGGEREEDHA